MKARLDYHTVKLRMIYEELAIKLYDNVHSLEEIKEQQNKLNGEIKMIIADAYSDKVIKIR